MATTLKKLKELSLKTIEAVIKSPEAWKKYLSTTPRTFRYSFEDQILIYAQAPKATAVAKDNIPACVPKSGTLQGLITFVV